MMIKEEGGSVYEKMTQKKKKVKSTGSQTVIRIEEDHQSDTQAKAKVKKKKCLAEEDSDQLNLSKKKKVGSKLKKKACSDNSVSIGSSSDSELVKEIKEKSKVLQKKSKKDQGLSLLTLENNQDSDQDLPKKHKTHSQENTVIDVKHRENVAQNSEGDNVVSKKKKKKKKKERDVSSLALMEIQDSDHKVSNKNLKKQNKTTLHENALAAKKHRKNVVQNSGIMKKKKKKKDKHDSLSLAGNQDNNHRASDENLSTRDFRKNQETNSQESTFVSKKQKEDIVQNSESDREVTKKKKKKKSKDISSLICEDNQDQSHRVSNKHLPRKKEARSQEKALAGKKHRENSVDDSEVTKKKKKNIQKEEEEVTESINLVDEGGEVSESEKITPVKSNRKNRKRKSKPLEDLTVDNVDEGLHENNNVHYDNKGKKRNKQGSQNFAAEPRLKKKKKVTVKIEKNENEAMECKDDVTVVEERKGNCDEINIDKVRRQALQEEIDRESGKTKVFRNKVESDTKFGQWSTATFESSDQKTKFLKLMGGFKKGSASTQDLPATTEKPNMALNRKGEETLKQTLQMEFEKAINLKQHRGIGLGFQPISNKKVHIDTYASRSVKFDD